jgi:hypothetical protein
MERLAESHDFFAGSEVALWNLRWQMAGFNSIAKEVTQPMTSAKFADHLGHKGSNAYSLILQRSWDETEATLNQMRLLSVFSIYEAWAEEASQELNLSKTKQTRWDAFVQAKRPDLLSAPRRSIEPIIGPNYRPMAGVAKRCRSNNIYMPSRLATLGLCYRAFKELRNAMAHAGGTATARTVTAVNNYHAALRYWKGITKSSPAIKSLSLGDVVEVDDYSVVGLSEVLRIQIFTFDGMVSESRAAYDASITHFQSQIKTPMRLPANSSRREASFVRAWKTAALPAPLKANRLMENLIFRGILVV